MAGPADFACAILTAPAIALLAIAGSLIATLLGGEPHGDDAVVAGMAAFAVLPPATITLRARVRGLRLDWTCLLLCVTILSIAATFAAISAAPSLVYAWFMRDF